jgi:hypothetical protein
VTESNREPGAQPGETPAPQGDAPAASTTDAASTAAGAASESAGTTAATESMASDGMASAGPTPVDPTAATPPAVDPAAAGEAAGEPAVPVDEDLPLTPPEVGASTETSTAADSMGGSAPPPVAGADTAETPTDAGDVTLEMPVPTGAAEVDAPAADTSSTGAVSTDAAPADASSAGAVASDAAWTDAASTEAVSTETASADAVPTDAGGASTEAVATDGVSAEVAPADAAAGTAGAAATGEALKAERIQLVGESGHSISVGVKTPLGKHMVRQFGDDFNVWDTEQCTVERGPDGAWQLVPQAGTTNETLLNGQPVTEPRPLREGDVIAVGRAEKGIAKLPLTVRAG